MSDFTDISNATDGGGSQQGDEVGGGEVEDRVESFFRTDTKMMDICDRAAPHIYEFEGSSEHKLVTYAVSQEIGHVSTELNSVGYMVDMVDNFAQIGGVEVDIPRIGQGWGTNESSKENKSVRMELMPFIEGQITNAKESLQTSKAGVCRYCVYRFLNSHVEENDILSDYKSYQQIIKRNKQTMESDIRRVKEDFYSFLRFRFDVDRERTIETLEDSGFRGNVFANEYYDLFKDNAGYKMTKEEVGKERLDNVEEVIEEALDIEG